MISCVFSTYLAYLDCGLLQNNRNGPQSKLAVVRKKHGKSSKIKKNLDYLGVFLDILLVLGKNSCSLAAKL